MAHRLVARLLLVSLMLLSAASNGWAGQGQIAIPETIEHRQVNIMSEGVRMSGEVYTLKSLAGKQLPTIIMSHGWGGVAALLRREAIEFAKAGYFVLAFDYRGWGASDSRVILTGAAPAKKEGNRFTAEVLEVREVVDPLEMTTDIFNAIHWAMGEPMVDKNRIGLWGSSYSGGHVVYVAARDPRVKATVSQVPSLDSRPAATALAGKKEEQYNLAYDEATKRARGEIGYPAPRARVVGNLQGAPIRDKLLRYAPVEDAAKRTDCAMMFIVAEKEELFDNKEHAYLAHERARGPKKYVVIPGITHYGIYTTAREQAIKLALDWFNEHLRK